MTTCFTCKKPKSLNEFSSASLRKGQCLECGRKASRKSYYKHRSSQIERSREYRKLNPNAGRDAKFRYKYGISLEQYNSILKSQNGVCAICNKSSDRLLDVDHNHSTGLVRGLLCRACNLGIGQFRENPSIIRKAIVYLESL